jgi:hypothetical protein
MRQLAGMPNCYWPSQVCTVVRAQKHTVTITAKSKGCELKQVSLVLEFYGEWATGR